MKRYFCTLFDSNYLIKGLTMINSLTKYCKEFEIYVLCIDHKTKNFLEKINISQVKCIDLYDVENKSLLKASSPNTWLNKSTASLLRFMIFHTSNSLPSHNSSHNL